ncbi:hypothetical protein [Pedosphaera parvula]|uniref:Uncharacterized protein n=1 Tax=Pedosphaera parvula (strain Ellin514) TaxID=320771 RepID=B9XPH1_PEDPL|nr:hypothetical protein [Pedosphaera parvula]EEF58311.1 hypothetical protein Cflav_PD1039 [Pedosphaera parvula Ellin514]
MKQARSGIALENIEEVLAAETSPEWETLAGHPKRNPAVQIKRSSENPHLDETSPDFRRVLNYSIQLLTFLVHTQTKRSSATNTPAPRYITLDLLSPVWVGTFIVIDPNKEPASANDLKQFSHAIRSGT